MRGRGAAHRPRLKVMTAAAVLVLTSTACSGDPPSILDPAGPGAARVEGLWWPMLWISVAVFAVVAVMLVMAAMRGRGTRDYTLSRREVTWGEPFIAIAGVFLPFLILAGVYVFSLNEMNQLAADGSDADLVIEVSGRNWWWEASYPNGAVTANEIHIPVGEPVRFELTTRDVIHSFWVPQLQVKTDQIPGRTNITWLQADSPGRYRGQCAEYCGLQHTNMVFYIVADPQDQFDDWLDNEAADAVDAASETMRAGEDIFMDSSCVGCHAIRGTEADARLGPDLTHLASRSTIGGSLPNTRSNLTQFVRDAHELKPGVSMPPAEITPEELDLLVDYLESLD
jgi:cytochrome c oxidase subunit II